MKQPYLPRRFHTSGIKVIWKKVTGATKYYIYRRTGTSGSYAKVKTITSGNTANWTDTSVSSLTKGKTYYVRVRAYKTVSGTKYYSAWSSAKSVKVSK